MNFYILNPDESTAKYINDLNLAASKGEIDLKDIHLCGDDDNFGDKVIVHKKSGLDFLVDYLTNATSKDIQTDDQFIPSHNAPHILAKVIFKMLEMKGFKPQMADFPAKIGTPYEIALDKGVKAISFANNRCPDNCIEPEICPLISERLNWDIGKVLKGYAKRYREVHYAGFECSHFAKSVSTIPMKIIINGWFEIDKAATSAKKSQFLIATHSKCHGIAA